MLSCGAHRNRETLSSLLPWTYKADWATLPPERSEQDTTRASLADTVIRFPNYMECNLGTAGYMQFQYPVRSSSSCHLATGSLRGLTAAQCPTDSHCRFQSARAARSMSLLGSPRPAASEIDMYPSDSCFSCQLRVAVRSLSCRIRILLQSVSVQHNRRGADDAEYMPGSEGVHSPPLDISVKAHAS